MQRRTKDILRTARGAAFVVAACALQASGAYARQAPTAGTQPPAATTAPAEPRPAHTPASAPAPTPNNAPPANPLPADPPAVAPNYEASARSLPSAERVGVVASDPLALTLGEAIRMALENNNDIEATEIDVAAAEYELTSARGS